MALRPREHGTADSRYVARSWLHPTHRHERGDRDWFDHLSRVDGLDEANFWQHSGNQQFRALGAGEPFLFKLHSPYDYIVGGGFFSHFTILPTSIVWKAFGEKNGARTEEEMRTRIAR